MTRRKLNLEHEFLVEHMKKLARIEIILSIYSTVWLRPHLGHAYPLLK